MSELVIQKVSRWYGNVVAVNDVTMRIGPGITGLLGPNGAGKSTLLNMLAGFLPPSSGTVQLDGQQVFGHEQIYRNIGVVPEREEMYDSISGWKFVLANAQLHSLNDPEGAARKAIETVDMAAAQERDIRTYSKGMRQRIKLATAIVHEPTVLLLDEPFNGMDPRQRLHLMDVLRQMGSDGKTVLFSSHILEEVEQVASTIEVMVAGRHAASGDFRAIRQLMTQRPHQYVIRSSADRQLAAAIMVTDGTQAVELADGGINVLVTNVNAFSRAVVLGAAAAGIRLYEVKPADESLESVFSYLVARR